jgi:hypothetical protein
MRTYGLEDVPQGLADFAAVEKRARKVATTGLQGSILRCQIRRQGSG